MSPYLINCLIKICANKFLTSFVDTLRPLDVKNTFFHFTHRILKIYCHCT